jgi:MerR family copper efflux transcriptional regulator
MQIGEASRQSGLESTAIRFYEAEGALPEPVRTDSGYRDYTEGNVELLTFVAALRSLRLPLDDIRQIVELRAEGKAPCRQVRRAIEAEGLAIDSRIDELRRLRAQLGELHAAADTIVDDWPTTCVCHVLQN